MQIIAGRVRDLGGFSVKRVLPYALHRMVGPFIFFDHMGPVDFPPGAGIDVRPHPHINLATVTYLFDGTIHHRDSLGSDQLIEPGAINWMTAGTGIVHSERTPPALRESGQKLNGIQLWVALPQDKEEIKPSFRHHPKDAFPVIKSEGATVKLLLGSGFKHVSPVQVLSDMIYAEIKLKAGTRFVLPADDGRELGAYVVEGALSVEGEAIAPYSMCVGEPGRSLVLHATQDSLVMVVGGRPIGSRSIYWNFVSSDPARIEEAKKLWVRGPQFGAPRFAPIPGDDQEFIPLPAT